MCDYDKCDELLEKGFPEKFREALQISHKLSTQISHISDAISKEIDNKISIIANKAWHKSNKT